MCSSESRTKETRDTCSSRAREGNGLRCSGRVCKEVEGGKFTLAFHSVEDALGFCNEAQQRLLKAGMCLCVLCVSVSMSVP